MPKPMIARHAIALSSLISRIAELGLRRVERRSLGAGSHSRRERNPNAAVASERATKAGRRNGTPIVSSAIASVITKHTPARNARPIAATTSVSELRRNPTPLRIPTPASTNRMSAAAGPTSTRMTYPRDRVARRVLRRDTFDQVDVAARSRCGAVEDEPIGLLWPVCCEIRQQPVGEPLVDGYVL